MKTIYALTATLLTLSMFLAACGVQGNPTGTPTFEGIETSTEEMTFEPMETGTPGLEGSETPMADETGTQTRVPTLTSGTDRTGTPNANQTGTPNANGSGTPSGTMNPTRVPLASLTLNVAQDATLGSYLVDDQGMTVYLNANDTTNTSNCTGDCIEDWPPVLINEDVEVTAGTGVDEAKIGHIVRSDGGVQVTYNGWPLYYYNDDTHPGDVTGQGEDDFYAVSPAGEMINK
jgi:predicted lipoprotein with Yx(FWY)xxD motif